MLKTKNTNCRTNGKSSKLKIYLIGPIFNFINNNHVEKTNNSQECFALKKKLQKSEWKNVREIMLQPEVEARLDSEVIIPANISLSGYSFIAW